MRVSACLVAAGLLCSCTVQQSVDPASSFYPAELQGVTVPATKAAPTQFTLAAPVEAYSTAWGRALSKLPKFDAAVGVVALAEDESISIYCAENPPPEFEANGMVVPYCRAEHAGPDPLPYAGMILVPYRTYQAALQTGDPEYDQVAKNQGTALLMAAAYAQHIVIDLHASQVLTQSQADQLGMHANCLAGLIMHSYIPGPLSTSQWDKIWAFLAHLSVANMPAWNPSQIMAGFESGKLRTCMS